MSRYERIKVNVGFLLASVAFAGIALMRVWIGHPVGMLITGGVTMAAIIGILFLLPGGRRS